MARMAVVVSCVNAPALAEECTKWLLANTSANSIVFLLDNGSTPPLPKFDADKLVRFHENIGGNAVFHDMLPHLDAFGVEFVAFLHCDMMVREQNWDYRIIKAFDADPKLALCGFVGSYEIDEHGGRGGGTALSYVGDHYPGFGTATKAEDHGRRLGELEPAAVLDHCSMIFRVSALKQLLPQPGNYAPGHFYDRICCAQCIHNGWHVGMIGIACDHFSGGVAGGMESQLALYRKWLTEEGLTWAPGREDQAVYVESERRFLSRFRDKYKLIPYRVHSDYSVTHYELGRTGWQATPYRTLGLPL